MERFRELWTAPAAPDEGTASGDYLQDPELWLDRLPQPFRMIDGLLQELLSLTWDEIESRQIVRESERARVRIPEIVAEATVDEALGVRVARSGGGGRDGVLFLGCRDGLRLVAGGGEELAFSATASAVTGLSVEQVEDIQIIAVCTKSGSTYFLACIWSPSGPRLIQLSEMPNQGEQTRPIAVGIAQNCTHMALITEVDGGQCQVECYQLPKSSWLRELGPLLREHSSEDSVPGAKSSADMVFSAASQLFIIPPPSPLLPCSAPSQHDALQNVFKGGEVIATGDHHMLTEAYLKNRRRAFESQRTGFIKSPSSPTSEKSTPKFHFIYCKNGTNKQEEPCSILVWWTNHTQLHLYSLSSKGSSPVLEKVIPHGGAVAATAVSHCTRYLAVGLASGIITIWDLMTNFCCCVQQVVSPPDAPSALLFCPTTPAGLPSLAVGTNKGSVLLVKSDLSITSLNTRMSKQQETYPPLFEGSGYSSGCEILSLAQCPGLSPSIVACVHVDGSLVLWNIDHLEPLCRVVLPPSSNPPTSPPASAFTQDYIFIAGSGVHISSVKYLRSYITTQSSEESQTTSTVPEHFMDNLQLKLEKFSAKINKDNNAFQTIRKSKWESYSQYLQTTSS